MKEEKDVTKEVKKETDDEGFISPSAPDVSQTNGEVKKVVVQLDATLLGSF